MFRLTEIETLSNNKYQMYRLMNLSKKDPETFNSICDYLPFYITINTVKSLRWVYYNNEVKNSFGSIAEDCINKGAAAIENISDQNVLKQVLFAIDRFKNINDHQAILTLPQRVEINEQMTWVVSNKMFYHTDDQFFNLFYSLKDLGKSGRIIEDILGETFIKRDGWEIFCSLTKREKEIMKLLAQGQTSKEIGNTLFISKLTADTHRKNLFSKLDVKSYTELIKLSQAFDIIET